MASVMCLDLCMQEEDILDHTNVKCILCTLQSTFRPLCKHKHTPHNTIEHTRAKIVAH